MFSILINMLKVILTRMAAHVHMLLNSVASSLRPCIKFSEMIAS